VQYDDFPGGHPS